jgi:hypothetical protein
MACRRNNKSEKRKRNREYARKFQTKVDYDYEWFAYSEKGIFY